MKVNRREFAQTVGLSLGTLTVTSPVLKAGSAEEAGIRIGMCDWNLGSACDPDLIPKAQQAKIHGLQVSVGTDPDNIALRSPEVRRKYLELGKKHGVKVASVAAGGILNQIPLKSEPQSAVYVIDAIEAASVLGAKNILIAFFGNGDLRLSDSNGELRNTSRGEYKSYELDSAGVTRVVEVMKQIAPRAEDAGVALGLENTLTAEQNLEIIDRIGSDIVQVYYDVGNSTHYGYDIASEIRLLGNDRICEIHIKDWKAPLLNTGIGEVDFKAAAKVCKDIGFDKWYVLESSGRKGKFMEDTHANVAFVQALFG